MLAPRCGRALQAGLFVKIRDVLQLLLAWWKGLVKIDGMPGPYVGQGVRAGCQIDILGWVLLGQCLHLGVGVHSKWACLAIASCLVEGFGHNDGLVHRAGSESGCRVDARMGLRGQCLHLGVGVHSKRACS